MLGSARSFCSTVLRSSFVTSLVRKTLRLLPALRLSLSCEVVFEQPTRLNVRANAATGSDLRTGLDGG
ncbi:hypothetical protein GCM10009835_50820 [Planosporangium flavigriseum]